MNLPDLLYEALPYLYLLAGSAALVGTDPTIGRVSGALLIVAAAWIMRLRRQYRKGFQ